MSYSEAKTRSQKKIHAKAKLAFNEFIKVYPFAANLDIEDEIWRDIEGCEGYKVSNYGRVKNIKFAIPRILTPTLDPWGYLRIAIRQDGKNKSKFIHGLVARAFVPNPDNKPYVHHIDGNKFNCHSSNLAWVTRSENMKYNFQLGLSTQPQGEESFRAILKNNQAEAANILYATGRYSYQEIGDILGATAHVIGEIIRGETYRNCRVEVEEIINRFQRSYEPMENLPAIQTFKSEGFGEIRTAGTPDNPLFCLADVCRALELPQVAKVVQRLDKDVLTTHPLQTAGGMQIFYFVNEDGLYDVILDSRKPEAKKFRKWITSEVLPSIRKTGEYKIKPEPSTPKNPEKSLECAKLLLDAAKLTDNASLRDELLSQMARLIILW